MVDLPHHFAKKYHHGIAMEFPTMGFKNRRAVVDPNVGNVPAIAPGIIRKKIQTVLQNISATKTGVNLMGERRPANDMTPRTNHKLYATPAIIGSSVEDSGVF